MLKNILLATTMFFAQWCLAQNGTISGKIMDGEFNDVLPFANVAIKGTTVGTTSDFEGAYSLDIEPGTYTVTFSFLGYTTQEITGVVVEANQTVSVNVTLQPAASQLDEVVLTTTVRKNTEASVLNLQKNDHYTIFKMTRQKLQIQ